MENEVPSPHSKGKNKMHFLSIQDKLKDPQSQTDLFIFNRFKSWKTECTPHTPWGKNKIFVHFLTHPGKTERPTVTQGFISCT